MEITQIKIRRLMNDGRLRALVSIVLDDLLAVHDIKVINGHSRLFVAMPSRQETDGTYRDIVHPLNSELREKFEKQIISAYYAALKNLELSIDDNPSDML